MLKLQLLIIFLALSQYSCDRKIINDCRDTIKDIGIAVSQLSICFSIESTNSRTCSGCSVEYLELLNKANHFNNNSTSLSGDKCSTALKLSDMFQTIPNLVKNTTELWNKSNCNLCFTNPMELINIENKNTTDNFKYFLVLHSNLMDCLSNHTNTKENLCNELDLSIRNVTYNNTGCSSCKDKYRKLLKYYKKLKGDANNPLCGDIENLFLCTRTVYEKRFNCPGMVTLFTNCVPLIVVFAVTLLFYSCSSICRGKSHIEIYSQYRVTPCHTNSGSIASCPGCARTNGGYDNSSDLLATFGATSTSGRGYRGLRINHNTESEEDYTYRPLPRASFHRDEPIYLSVPSSRIIRK